ncbi:MAG: DUF2326 domain-containing protein [Synergistaceae bacterium]|jgi:uncharacterized protein YydD (DUF2326 family)|nr:DUF2326 domain-containing protein [Synergistaceae bacterium]
MKLIALTANNQKFRSVKFNPTGLSLILGDKSTTSGGGSNGSGKTLALRLVHLCLGSSDAPTPVKECLPDAQFELQFSIGGTKHAVVRSGNGKKIWLDEKPITLAKYREWLDDSGVFRKISQGNNVSFRSLLSRFARKEEEDWLYPERTSREPDSIASLRSLYLLGVDPSLILGKIQHKKAILQIEQSKKLWENDPILKKVSHSGVKPLTQINHLQKEIERLEEDLANFVVAEDYRELEVEANKKTEHIRQIDQKIVRLSYEKSNIESLLQVEPDISKKELLRLYEGLEHFFKPEALEHLAAVEQFHADMIQNRRKRLEADLVRINSEMQTQNTLRDAITTERESIFQDLTGKRALDEYAAVSSQLSTFKEQYASLMAFAEFDDRLEKERLELKQRMAADDALAAAYKDTAPLASYSRIYASLTERIYPNAASGLVLENNIGDSQLRFNFNVELAGSESVGINSARIVCFDWLLFMYGQNHRMNFLWHDSSLFSDNDSAPRAKWFSYILKALKSTGKQYIVSLIHENFSSMKEHMSEEDFAALQNAQILNLSNARDETKLLGLTISKP